MHSTVRTGRFATRGFTLIELLVVIGILAVLSALLLPSLTSAKQKGKLAGCISNLRQTGFAIHGYASDNDGLIPYGPVAPPFTSPSDFYPSTGAPTSLLSLRNGRPVGLGLLLQHYLAATPKVLFCPGTDQPVDSDLELAKVGKSQAQGSYYYRHGGVTKMFFTPSNFPTSLNLDDLGKNRAGEPIRALAIDSIFLAPPDLAEFNIRTRTHHRKQAANVLFADGHVATRSNPDGRFTVDLTTYAEVHDTFSKILKALENADEDP